jgi:hypothetical protein
MRMASAADQRRLPTSTSCPRARRPSIAAGGKSGSTKTRSGTHWWWKRGAATASSIGRPKSTTFTIESRVVLMMRGPPGLPVTSRGAPSFSTMVGVMLESGRLPGAMALAPRVSTRP